MRTEEEEEEEEVGRLVLTDIITGQLTPGPASSPASQPSPAQPSRGEERRGFPWFLSAQVPTDLPASYRASTVQPGHLAWTGLTQDDNV